MVAAPANFAVPHPTDRKGIIHLIQRIRDIIAAYPRQFWLMFFGMFISTVGASMIWPFLLVYVSGKLNRPLGTVASLLTINAAISLGAAFIAGPITDRFGRKWVLVISLIGNGMVYLLLGQAVTLLHFAVLMVFWGLFSPLYRVGGDAHAQTGAGCLCMG
ncbi:MAG TPA: MFS transporter [Anaerolineales bacterium]|nr:MFS transporter [Anaerolineales bacterium]